MLSKRRSKMKKVILFALVLAVSGVLLNSVLAQEYPYPDESSDTDVAIAPEYYEGVPRYLVTYARSQTGGGIRSATVVTVTNPSSAACSVQVEFFTDAQTIPVCTINQTVNPGIVRQFCSRTLPNTITNCGGVGRICSPELTGGAQGRAVVSSDPVTCPLGVDARVYYTTAGTPPDTAISAISNSKIVNVNTGNEGD
jgi:hypothetical protein